MKIKAILSVLLVLGLVACGSGTSTLVNIDDTNNDDSIIDGIQDPNANVGEGEGNDNGTEEDPAEDMGETPDVPEEDESPVARRPARTGTAACLMIEVEAKRNACLDRICSEALFFLRDRVICEAYEDSQEVDCDLLVALPERKACRLAQDDSDGALVRGEDSLVREINLRTDLVERLGQGLNEEDLTIVDQESFCEQNPHLYFCN